MAKKAMYLIISRCSDEPHIKLVDRPTLERLLKPDDEDGYTDYEFLETPPDWEYMPERSAFIFKGEVVIPQAKETVTKWEVE